MEKDCLDCLYFTDVRHCPLFCRYSKKTKERFQKYVNEFNKFGYCACWTDKAKKKVREKKQRVTKQKIKVISLLRKRQLSGENRRLQITKKVRKKK